MANNNNQLLAIEYEVWINGSQLGIDKKACIESIQVKETVDGADTCEIKINDPNFLFIEDNIFIEDNKIKVKLGWSDTTYRITFEGYISAVDISFPESGLPQLTITCMDNTHLMNRKKKDNTYKNTTSAKVVQKIAKSYGFKCAIDSDYKFETQETITQSQQTDIDFITKLAEDEVYPFTARLVGNTFYYTRKGILKSPKMTLNYLKYPHEVVSFSPKINKESIQVEVSSSVVNASDKTLSTNTLTSDKTSNSKTGGSTKGSSNNSSSSSNKTYTYDPNTKTWNS